LLSSCARHHDMKRWDWGARNSAEPMPIWSPSGRPQPASMPWLVVD
jgi:hypothetical protein